MKKNKKQRKNSMLTIGAFAVVGILIVGTIVGILAGSLFTGDGKDEDSIPLTRQLKNTDAATATAAAAETETATTAETEKPKEQTEASPASEQATADKDGKQTSESKKPEKTSKPKKTKKPKKTPVPTESNPAKDNSSQSGQGKTGQDNEISFSEFQ